MHTEERLLRAFAVPLKALRSAEFCAGNALPESLKIWAVGTQRTGEYPVGGVGFQFLLQLLAPLAVAAMRVPKKRGHIGLVPLKNLQQGQALARV